MSFSCPHFFPNEDHCLRLKTDCVPGRKGCVLVGRAEFAVPAEERVRLRAEEKRREQRDALPPRFPPTAGPRPGSSPV